MNAPGNKCVCSCDKTRTQADEHMEYLTELARIVVASDKLPMLRDRLAYTGGNVDPFPRTKLSFQPTPEERDARRQWHERTRWKANLLHSMCVALLDWTERERADSAIDLMIWLAAVQTTKHRDVWSCPMLPAVVLISQGFRKGKFQQTDPAKYNEFVEYVVKHQTTPQERALRRAQMLFYHPHGPNIDLGLRAYQGIADDPDHPLRFNTGPKYEWLTVECLGGKFQVDCRTPVASRKPHG